MSASYVHYYLVPQLPNASLQLLPEAGAQRTLEAVSCKALLGDDTRFTIQDVTPSAPTQTALVALGGRPPGASILRPPDPSRDRTDDLLLYAEKPMPGQGIATVRQRGAPAFKYTNPNSG
jgi:hypothetical protein